jgi:hypothetical protein
MGCGCRDYFRWHKIAPSALEWELLPNDLLQGFIRNSSNVIEFVKVISLRKL